MDEKLRSKYDTELIHIDSGIGILPEKLLDSKRLGYTATKKLGNAVRRNRAKRLMREIARNIINQYGKKNFSYVLIAKKQIFDTPIQKLENELRELVEK